MTTPLYLHDWNQFTCTAVVKSITTSEGKTSLILDQTVFYPQGGGQPWDTGTIRSENGIFRVTEVRHGENDIDHFGNFEAGSIAIGETVSCAIDDDRRKLHSRLHSAGHVIDIAIERLKLGWKPGKGYHFPAGPYDEYVGSLGDRDREVLKKELEAACNAVIAEDRITRTEFTSPEHRLVYYGDFSMACGGTHVNRLSEIGPMTIRKIKPEGERIKIGYDVSR